MRELNRQRKRVRVWDRRLGRPKEVWAALVAAGWGTKAQIVPGWVLAVVLTANLGRAGPAQAERQLLGLANPLAQARTAVEGP